MSSKQSGVNAVETAIQILAALARSQRPQMLKDIARLADMHPAKVHRYLVSMIRQDMVHQDSETGLYGWGPRALDIGMAALRSVSFIRVAAKEAAALRDKTEVTVAVAVWGTYGATHVLVEESHRDIVTKSQYGSVLPLLTSATGRVFAAFLPASATRLIIATEIKDLTRRYGSETTCQSEVDAILANVRANEIAQALGDYWPGIHALCCPVFDHNESIVGALTVLAPAGQFDPDIDGPVAQALREAAQRVSDSLGRAKMMP
ncbi:hypothetical protein A6U85_25260 [Agrobacterium sp. 13-626]|nr:hypothetical protein A6U85_25260 [Agrobacterium sp. 13-626]